MPDWRNFANEIVADMVDTGSDYWDEFSQEQKGIVEEAARDLAEATMLLIQNPDAAEIHQATITSIKGTLILESTLAALEIQNKLKESAERALLKLAGIGLAMLV